MATMPTSAAASSARRRPANKPTARRGGRSRRAARGLTLLEIMVVLAILALTLALAPPAMMQVSGRWRLRTAAHQVEDLVIWAQNAAVEQGAAVQLRYDVPGGIFWVRVGDRAMAQRALPAGVHFAAVRFGPNLEVTQDIASCSAYPDGTVDFHEVLLRDEDSGRVSLTFNRLLGDAAYEESWNATP